LLELAHLNSPIVQSLPPLMLLTLNYLALHPTAATLATATTLCLPCLLCHQAANPRQNYLAVLKLADLGQGRHGKKPEKEKKGDESSDEDDESSEEEDESSSEDASMDEADEGAEGKTREGRLTARREGKEPPARMHHR